MKCDGIGPAHRESLGAAGMDALAAPAAGDAMHVGERRSVAGIATPSPSVTLVKGTNTPFCHYH